VLAFAAHLGNWEMPGLIAPSFGIPSAMAYRMPNNRAVAAHILNLRRGLMGELIRGETRAGLAMRRVLGEGKLLGMLIDQHFSRGVEIAFLGRACWANPTLARLARRFDCPVIGARVIRLPGGRFRVEVTPPLDLPRDGEGRIDVIGATQAMNDLISAWVREHPEQYLWFHRRWRIAQPRMAWAARRR
jgi:KDO2-lipid IV(A) lauroyltransferase